MKVKCSIILNAVQIINELAEKPMKISLAAKLLRLSDDLQKESDFIDKQRRTIIEKYGKKDENGELIINDGNVSFDGDIAEKVQEELSELANLELDITDRNLLSLLINSFQGGPVGIETIAAALSEDVRTLEDVCEPYLLQSGLLQRTPRGRKVSPTAYKHLKYQCVDEQRKLF